MGDIKDIMQLVRLGPKMLSNIDPLDLGKKSIIRGANDATIQYPVLMSTSVSSIDMMSTIARNLERTYASFTQTWFSLNPYIDISIDRGPIDYIRRFHQNINVESADEVDEYEESLKVYKEHTYDGSDIVFTDKYNKYAIGFRGVDKFSRTFLEEYKDSLRTYMEGFDLHPIYETNYDDVMTEADTSNNVGMMDFIRAATDNETRKNKLADQKNRSEISSKMKNPEIMDSTLKKSNDMQPYGIEVRLMAKNADDEFVNYIDFVVGVKAILHPIDPDDMIENLVRSVSNRSVAFKFLKWRSGEISLFKDLILNLDDIKWDVASKGSGSSPWFATLRRLKDKKFKTRSLTVPTKILPNATITISEYETSVLLDKYGIDVMKPAIAKKIMKDLFLIAFVVVDNGSETISILYDGSNSYQTYSLEMLEREVSLNSNKLGKEIGRMLTK